MGGRATGSQSNTGVGKIAVWGEGMIGISWRVVLTTSSGYWLRPQAKHVKGLLQQPLSSVAQLDDLRQ
jgi:hypothetical protein